LARILHLSLNAFAVCHSGCEAKTNVKSIGQERRFLGTKEDIIMLSARWQPWLEMQSEVNRLRDEMDRLFGRWTHRRVPLLTQGVFPLLNAWEDEGHYFVEAELPGMQLEDLEIFVNGSQLTIKGERTESPGEQGTWHRRERGHGRFARVFELPHAVDAEHVTAELKQGVLTITLPKQPESRPRRIEVKAD